MDLSGPSRASVICTLGMHRSGTSLVSRMLGLLGVRLGPDERVLTAGEDNPKGYWEHRSFVDLNDEILPRFGGRWDEAPGSCARASPSTWRPVGRGVSPHLWSWPAYLMGNADALHAARWCHETCYAVTKDGNEDRFLAAWGRAAGFLQGRGVHSGEGGVMGLAAAYAGWTPDYEALAGIASLIQHEGGGPKEA